MSSSMCKYLTVEQAKLPYPDPLTFFGKKKLSRQEIANLIKGLENFA